MRSESAAASTVPIVALNLDTPSPAPGQVFAIGLNYDEHAAESGFERLGVSTRTVEEAIISSKFFPRDLRLSGQRP